MDLRQSMRTQQRTAPPAAARRTSLHSSLHQAGRTRAVVRCAVAAEYSQRVKGDLRRVFCYVTDVQTWPNWMPDISGAVRTAGPEHLALRSKFVAQRSVANWKAATAYEVVDVQLNKSVVYSASSDFLTATEQLVFMPDPLEPAGYTVVRYMSSTELRQWRAALLPLLGGTLSHAPEASLSRLAKLLASANTPLKDIKLPKAEEAAGGRTRSAGGSAPAWSFASLFGGARPASSGSSPRSAPSSASTSFGSAAGTSQQKPRASLTSKPLVMVTPADALGYYQTLGLPLGATTASTDDVKAAFRKAAQQYHPDKWTATGTPREREAANQRFTKAQKAYEVLKDEERRRQYDEGRLLEESTV